MADTRKLYTILALGLLLLAAISAVESGPEFDSSMMGIFATRSECDGTLGACLGGEDLMDSEISRRILATNNYISYGALNRNRVPCSRRGASYYNCRPVVRSLTPKLQSRISFLRCSSPSSWLLACDCVFIRHCWPALLEDYSESALVNHSLQCCSLFLWIACDCQCNRHSWSACSEVKRRKKVSFADEAHGPSVHAEPNVHCDSVPAPEGAMNID